MDRSVGLSLFALTLVSLTYSQGDNVRDYIANYGKPLDLICSNALKDDKTVTWFKGGLPLVPKENEFEVIAENHTLRIAKIEPKTVAETFSCKYNGSLEMAFSIKVRPYVIPFDPSRNVIQGDPLRLDCKAWGVPAPVSITWQRDSQPLLQDDSGRIILRSWGGNAGEAFPMIENGTIRITDMDYQDGGNYTCFVTSSLLNSENHEPLVVNATVLIQVKDKYAALWPFLGICVEVAILCTIILIYERRRAKRIEEEERQEEAAHLNANNESRPVTSGDEVRQRK